MRMEHSATHEDYFEKKDLFLEAISAMHRGFNEYGDYKVGCAIKLTYDTSQGKFVRVYKGSNTHMSAMSHKIHAEINALNNLISDRDEGIKDMNVQPDKVVVMTNGDELPFPCGECRQALYRVLGNVEIVAASAYEIEDCRGNNDYVEFSSKSKQLKELLPYPYRRKDTLLDELKE